MIVVVLGARKLHWSASGSVYKRPAAIGTDHALPREEESGGCPSASLALVKPIRVLLRGSEADRTAQSEEPGELRFVC